MGLASAYKDGDGWLGFRLHDWGVVKFRTLMKAISEIHGYLIVHDLRYYLFSSIISTVVRDLFDVI